MILSDEALFMLKIFTTVWHGFFQGNGAKNRGSDLSSLGYSCLSFVFVLYNILWQYNSYNGFSTALVLIVEIEILWLSSCIYFNFCTPIVIDVIVEIEIF